MPLTLNSRPTQLPEEILDNLPPDDPSAQASRRDLRYFNIALGNWKWIKRTIPSLIRPEERILEIGAGTGELGAAMSGLNLGWDALDRVPKPSRWPAQCKWHEADIFSFGGWASYPVLVGNLIFHHFGPAQLDQIGETISRHARVLVVGDLRRGLLQHCFFQLYARAIRAHPISLHDGSLSVRSGFKGDELAQMLKLDPARWSWRVECSQICAYRFVAHRRQ